VDPWNVIKVVCMYVCNAFLPGVLWLHTKALPGAPEVLNKFREMGKRVFYITNNNVITREEFLVKCDSLGYRSMKVSGRYFTTVNKGKVNL
jgi:ribonucleotide monophosphatase NagD (HAD superfamily)